MALDDLRAFLAVVEQGSQVAAARSLDFARGALHRQVESLEASIGTPLINRVSGGVVLTRAGERLAERGRRVLREVNTIWDAAKTLSGETPLIPLEIPVGMPPAFEQALYSTLRRAAPLLRFEVRYTSGQFTSDTDAWLSLHTGPVTPSPEFKARRVAALDKKLLASSDYLSSHARIQSTDDLTSHAIVVSGVPEKDGKTLPLLAGGTIPIRPILVTQNAHLLRKMAGSGHAIAFAPMLPTLLRSLSEESKLEVVLGDVVGEPGELWISIRVRGIHPAFETVALALGRFLTAIMGSGGGSGASEWPGDESEGSPG
jgi:DNA-binding transcriptional LysR family regulator